MLDKKVYEVKIWIIFFFFNQFGAIKQAIWNYPSCINDWMFASSFTNNNPLNYNCICPINYYSFPEMLDHPPVKFGNALSP